MTETVTPRQAARWFASQGHPILPLHSITDDRRCTCGKADCTSPGKHPHADLAPSGLKDASTDDGVVRGWFDEHHWLNFGIRTDQFLVVDIDPRNRGDETWGDISAQPTRAVPHSWTVRTGGGGLHYIFANPGGLRAGDLDRGVEIKTRAGGYIVGVTCKHQSGRTYDWLPQCHPGTAPLAAPPAWLLEVINTRTYLGKVTPPDEWRKLAGGRLRDGERHKGLLRIAGHLIAIPGVDPLEVRELLIGWDEGRCDPPLGAREIVQIVGNICERELAKRKWL
jgi:hypothetical protein